VGVSATSRMLSRAPAAIRGGQARLTGDESQDRLRGPSPSKPASQFLEFGAPESDRAEDKADPQFYGWQRTGSEGGLKKRHIDNQHLEHKCPAKAPSSGLFETTQPEDGDGFRTAGQRQAKLRDGCHREDRRLPLRPMPAPKPIAGQQAVEPRSKPMARIEIPRLMPSRSS
jgi:hypothetical protein